MQRVGDEQEVLIVTLVNAAVDNFAAGWMVFARANRLLPGFNYRVCTLHSLAHEIVQPRPSLVGLSQDFDIVDDRTSELILREVVDGWLIANSAQIADYLPPGLELQPLLLLHLPELGLNIARSFINGPKIIAFGPRPAKDAYARHSNSLPLARMAGYLPRLPGPPGRTGVDFDDLIRLAAQGIAACTSFLCAVSASAGPTF